jgi:hypothetical protein
VVTHTSTDSSAPLPFPVLLYLRLFGPTIASRPFRFALDNILAWLVFDVSYLPSRDLGSTSFAHLVVPSIVDQPSAPRVGNQSFHGSFDEAVSSFLKEVAVSTKHAVSSIHLHLPPQPSKHHQFHQFPFEFVLSLPRRKGLLNLQL